MNELREIYRDKLVIHLKKINEDEITEKNIYKILLKNKCIIN